VPTFIVLFLRAISFVATESDFAVPRFSAHLAKRISFPRNAYLRIAKAKMRGQEMQPPDVASSCELIVLQQPRRYLLGESCFVLAGRNGQHGNGEMPGLARKAFVRGGNQGWHDDCSFGREHIGGISMASVTFATPLRASPRPWHYSAPTHHFSDDDAGLALNEAEANEFAVRLLDAQSEADFDHLLGAILTHAAARADVPLSPAVGSALGGVLKSIARQGLGTQTTALALGLEFEGLDRAEREFEAALQFVRLAAEAARHAAEEPVSALPREAAHAALAAASDIYAPPLTSYIETRGPFTSRASHLRSTMPVGAARAPLGAPTISVWIDPFDYDPEMEYFLGGFLKSVGRAVGGAVSGIARTVSKAAEAVGKIPILGDVARAGISAARLALGPAAIAIDAGSRLARGENLGRALTGAVGGQIDAIRDQLKLAEMVAPFVPGIGTGVAAALGAANALAAGRPITEAVLAAARSALPGGKIAQVAFDVATQLAKGKNIGEAALGALRDQLPGGFAAKAAFDTALNLAKGKNIGEAVLATTRDRLPGGFAARAAFDAALNLAKGKNVGEAALAAARDRLPGGPAARAAFDAAVALGQGKRLQDAAHKAAGVVLPPSPYAADALSFVKRVANGQNIQNAALSATGQRVLRQVRANAYLAARHAERRSTQSRPVWAAAARRNAQIGPSRHFTRVAIR
jgi:hypothetical protein